MSVMQIMLALALLACGEPAPTPVPSESAIDGKPTQIEDGGPTMADVVAEDAAIEADDEVPDEAPFADAAAAAAVNADGGEQAVVDRSAKARKDFNPISIPQDGDGVQDWDWPFSTKGRTLDINGDGVNEVEGKRKVKFSKFVDNEDDAGDLRQREFEGK